MSQYSFICPRLHNQFVRGALVLLIAGFIFLMSAQPADASSDQSLFFGTGLAYFLLWLPFSHEVLSHLGLPTVVVNLAPALDYAVRKTAHFSEYAALGFALAAWMRHTTIFHRHAYWLAVAVGAFYAVSDEWHQSFVPGRSCELTDMLIDTSGCLTGVLVYFSIKILMIFWKNKKCDPSLPAGSTANA